MHTLDRLPRIPTLLLAALTLVAGATMGPLLVAQGWSSETGDLRVVPALGALAATLPFAWRAGAREGVRVTVMLLAVEGALAAVVGTATLALWAVAAAWSLLARHDFFAAAWLGVRPSLATVARGATAGLGVLALLAAGIELRGLGIRIDEVLASGHAWGAAAVATCCAVGVLCGRDFEAWFTPYGETAWSAWMLWPSLAAMGATMLVRDDYPIWATAALASVSLFTIGGHALVMGQRVRPKQPGGRGEAPSGPIRVGVRRAPWVATFVLVALLAVAGVVAA